MLLSVIIPFYNEAHRLPQSLKIVRDYLKKRNYSSQIVLVDDGSTDGSTNLINDFVFRPDVVMITHERNAGKGAAVKSGVFKSEGDYILFLDADLSTPIEEVEKLMPFIEINDIVMGTRTQKDLLIKKQPFYRRFIGQFGNKLIKLFLKLPYDDTQCGFKMFKKEPARDLFGQMKMKRWSFDYEILYLAKKKKYRVKEVPVYWKNEKENSKFRPVRDSVRSFFDLLKIWWLHN